MLANHARAAALAFFMLPFAWANQSFASEGVPSVAKIKPVVEVAFVLDTTGSMGGLIEGAKRKIWSIATAIVDANPDAEIRMGLVAYRDIGDEYVTKTFPLTKDIQDLYANLLELKARGGGDWPESVNEALHVGVTKLSWTQGAEICRIMFLVGDAPPHMDYAQDVKYPEVMRMARERGIVVNAVQAGGARDTERVWREIAQIGPRPLHPDPAGRRPSGGDRDAVRHRDHRVAEPYQRHGDPLRTAPAARRRREEDQASRCRAGIGRHRHGRLHVAQSGENVRRSHHRRRRSGRRRRRPAGRSSTGRQGRRSAGQCPQIEPRRASGLS